MREGKKSWVHLNNETVQTRFRLKIKELIFKPSNTDASIQNILSTLFSGRNYILSEDPFNQFFLVSHVNTDIQYYNITEYIQRCLTGDISVAGRLRGRTILYIYQSDDNGEDILSNSGVDDFINRILLSYVETYGTDALLGFSIELPRFLSVFEFDGTSIPWSSLLLKHFREETFMDNQNTSMNTRWSFIPFLFYDRYNSPVIRSVFWQELTSQFARCFLGGLMKFCHQRDLRLAVTIRESAKSLQYVLGCILEKVDCPLLFSDDSDTSRRLVVTKSLCSNAQHVGIIRQKTPTVNNCLQDAVYGFNQWITNRFTKYHTDNNPSLYMGQSLQVGQPKRPILMLSPTQSVWMKPDEKQWNNITKAWGWLCETVWNMCYDYDIVSEVQLIDATIDKNKGTIYHKGNNYRLILLPSCISLQETTVKYLTDFTKLKGKLIVNAPVPYLLNGKIGLTPYHLERLIYHRRTTIIDGPEGERETEIRRLLRKWISPEICIYSGKENRLTESVRIHHRVDNNNHTYYLYNTTNEPISTLVEIIGEAEKVEELLLDTGRQKTLEYWHANGKTYMKCMFETKQGRLFVVT